MLSRRAFQLDWCRTRSGALERPACASWLTFGPALFPCTHPGKDQMRLTVLKRRALAGMAALAIGIEVPLVNGFPD